MIGINYSFLKQNRKGFLPLSFVLFIQTDTSKILNASQTDSMIWCSIVSTPLCTSHQERVKKQSISYPHSLQWG